MRKMHRFLKILLLIIFVWAVTWTFIYLSNVTSLERIETNTLLLPSILQSHRRRQEDDKIKIAVVACGEKALDQTVVLVKSILASSMHYGIQTIDVILFADDEHLHAMDLKIENVKNSTQRIDFRYEIHPVIFPARNHDEWRGLFKPCASQRLFLHSALPHINEILYLDVDTLVVGDLRQIWAKFRSMSSEQAVGLVPESEVASIGWYNRFARHPYYPPFGLNTGVMLMNLTRLREQTSYFDWENAILKNFKIYKDNITFGDQDLINIVFHSRPDKVYLLPCPFNFRTDHCQYGLNCNAAEADGVQIIHGSRSAFFKAQNFLLFTRLYEYFKNFDMTKGDFVGDVVVPWKMDADRQRTISSKKITRNCDNIGHLVFTKIRNHKSK